MVITSCSHPRSTSALTQQSHQVHCHHTGHKLSMLSSANAQEVTMDFPVKTVLQVLEEAKTIGVSQSLMNPAHQDTMAIPQLASLVRFVLVHRCRAATVQNASSK